MKKVNELILNNEPILKLIFNILAVFFLYLIANNISNNDLISSTNELSSSVRGVRDSIDEIKNSIDELKKAVILK